MAKPLVYRVDGISEHISREALLLAFTPASRPRIIVCSLSKAVNWDRTPTQTATILFSPQEAYDKPSLSASPSPSLVTIDSDFFGFTALYTPDGDIEADIVAVTGLAGHAFGSWALDSKRMWLRDFLPADLPKCRILTYGYNSRLDQGLVGSGGILLDHSKNFVQKLQNIRSHTRGVDRQIVLVGHSLGCLIIKDALIRFSSAAVDQDGDQKQRSPPIISVVFFGAPHHGLGVTALMGLVKETPSQKIIGELEPGSSTLRKLNDDFARLRGKFKILTIYELCSTPSICQLPDGTWNRSGPPVLMVSPDSAILNWNDNEEEVKIGVDYDHRKVAKLDRSQNYCYFDVTQFIENSIKGNKTTKRLCLPVSTSLRCAQCFSSDHLTWELQSYWCVIHYKVICKICHDAGSLGYHSNCPLHLLYFKEAKCEKAKICSP